ncbi:LuxR C-terminal-related transcriptional regulator [uncultured Draconibacterium sp.]|uniref:LuxR C-terminal-related transcriptional regulator n=1 Tax=uncultured Draconibacterium sp. TaxID=1573823 RepID=UPI0025E05CB4|nr:LuxR C-terminal-related transcriptional regulator [uncultured Draconibacterium sp.]
MQRDKLILLNMPDDDLFRQFCSILKTHKYRVTRAVTIQAAVQKIIEYSPDLIICSHNFLDYDAYQTYNLLRRTTLNCVTPYVVVVDNYDSDEIMMGLELGVDNFIFTPLNEKRIVTKLKLLFEKIDKLKAFERSTFEKLFVTSPIGMLVCETDRIERANPAFYQTMGFDKNLSLPGLKEIFDFSEFPEQQKQFCRCLKGLTNDCTVSDVQLKGGNEYRTNLYISNISNFVVNRLLIQVEVRLDQTANSFSGNDQKVLSETKQEQPADFELTSREYDILKISGKGTPIKLIAAELGISQRTVEKHRSNIMRKTDSMNIIEAIGKVYGMSQKLQDT